MTKKGAIRKGVRHVVALLQVIERCEPHAAAARWYKERSLPLPAAVPWEDKQLLQRVVQLMKRQRDKFFDSGTAITCSAILTTLAGHFVRFRQTFMISPDRNW